MTRCWRKRLDQFDDDIRLDFFDIYCIVLYLCSNMFKKILFTLCIAFQNLSFAAKLENSTEPRENCAYVYSHLN